MEENPTPSDKSSIPPPDLPKPAFPPPDLPKPEAAATPPPLHAAAGPVKVTIRETGDDDESHPKSGGIASFNSRVSAAVIDLVVAFALSLTLTLLLPFLAPFAWLPAVGYLIVRDSLPFLGGQSVGKKAMSIKVVDSEGGSISGNWQTSVIRNLILVIPPLALVELYVLLNREDKSGRGIRLGDEWAKTKVIVAEKPVPPADAAS